jgi:hypothetical protein
MMLWMGGCYMPKNVETVVLFCNEDRVSANVEIT